MIVDCLLQYIRKTNPEMTKEKMLEQLGKSFSSAVALVMVCQNKKK